MRIAIVHNAVSDKNMPDDADVLVQAEVVLSVLKKLGHEFTCLPCTLDLLNTKQKLESFKPDLVFNLVESLEGKGRLIHLFPTLLDAMGISYTGCCADAIQFTSNKIMAKERMLLHGLETPSWVGPYPWQRKKPEFPFSAEKLNKVKWIIKSEWEHASIGLNEDELIVVESISELETLMKPRLYTLGGSCFAETYIDGREFNLSILTGTNGPEVLPPAEIVFDGYGEEKLRIVGYRAKWDSDSYEFHHTPRRFDFPPEDRLLIQNLKEIAVKCWQVFGLAGYARVDFRVDSEGNPWILEINTNPCLSPDAGFAAAIERGGLTFEETIQRILEDARKSPSIHR